MTFFIWYCNLGQNDHSLLTVPDNSQGIFNHSKYQNDQISQWIIKSESNQNIKLEFIYFDVEEGSTCSYDSLTIITKDKYEDITIHGKYCYDQPTIRRARKKPSTMPFLRNFSPPVDPVIDSLKSVYFYGKEIRLILASDSAVVGDGFAVKWETVC